MLVTVLSYQDFLQMRSTNGVYDNTVENTFSNVIFISILDSHGWFSKPQFEADHKNTITLQFDDVTESGKPSPTNQTTNTRAFDESDGKKIISLLEANSDAKYCMVHCAAGISRSGAVGQFVNDFFKENYNSFRQRNSQIMPNQLITQTLNKLIR